MLFVSALDQFLDYEQIKAAYIGPNPKRRARLVALTRSNQSSLSL
jgi:hypothetical protein